MTHILRTAALAIVALIALTAEAYDFQADNFCFNITSADSQSCEVTLAAERPWLNVQVYFG